MSSLEEEHVHELYIFFSRLSVGVWSGLRAWTEYPVGMSMIALLHQEAFG